MENRTFLAAVLGGLGGGVMAVALLSASHFEVAPNPLSNATRTVSSGPAFASLGGSYQIANHQLEKKEKEFNTIRGSAIQWDSSTTRELDRRLFENSIRANSVSKVPYADRYQRYNYVVKRGSIRVATWTGDIGSMGTVCKSVPIPTEQSVYLSVSISKGVMINFFSEEPGIPAGKGAKPSAACSVKPPDADHPLGVLDAHSKHFMLAQDVDDHKGSKRLASLIDYVGPKSWATWKDTTVDYAGEIIVDVPGCYYIINNGSGTYRPDGGSRGDFSYLLRVAQLFEEKVGVSPVAVWDTGSILPVIKIPESGKPLRCA